MAYSQEHKVFGLQDIFPHIITYLNSESQVACLQVSRLFHEAITPKVYASVTLSPLEVCRPSLETLRRYSSLVMALSFDAFISAEYLGAGFRNLMSLSLTSDQDSYLFEQGTGNVIVEALLKVMKENPRLSQWSFEKPYPALSAKVWEAIEGTAHRLPEVSKVELHNAQDSTATATDYSSTSVVIAPQAGRTFIDQEALPWATIACEKAEALLMIPAKLEPFNAILEYPDRVVPRPYAPIAHYVGLHNVYQCSSMERLEFLSLFNQARGIYWNISKTPSVAWQKRIPRNFKDWQQWIRPNTTWPCLRSLGIEALAGHFSTLREVNLELTSSLEQSAYIQRIMESCPHLQVLRAGHLSVGDMRRGRPWACIGLKSLSVRFDMQEDRIEDVSENNIIIARPAIAARERKDYKKSQRYVFSRLSELVLLEELTSIPLQAAGPNFYKT
ncbi:hypothetical protein K457DRAFT_12900 [Linnemannia elongata AG-77]|uniref:F-box domain-containing protein n=1 Tax=Linnemannia elongata AG-77 TaxID=1314771 RepID=A0A197KG75_9FUNG|nr:hypothetical protein K457DRAFT_12900 [Linnemannia elongata AG-77]